MKRKFFTTTALVCCFVVCLAIAADLKGVWSGALKAPDGNDYPMTFTFKTDGDKLTGMAKSSQGDGQITDGKITGDAFAFTIPFNGVDVKYTGKLYAAADSIGMDVDYEGTKMHVTLKRDSK